MADVVRFRELLTRGSGLLLLECDNSRESIIVYLAALKYGCPVCLVDGSKQSVDRPALSFTYHFTSSDKQLRVSDETAPKFHEDLAILLSTSGSTGTAK